jgi:hypothetical protein
VDKITDNQVSFGGSGENKLPNWFIVTESNEVKVLFVHIS